jgi:hypothetical protein
MQSSDNTLRGMNEMPKKRKPYISVSGRTAEDIVPAIRTDREYWVGLRRQNKKKK